MPLRTFIRLNKPSVMNIVLWGLSLAVSIVLLTFYENRNEVFQRVVMSKIEGVQMLYPPSDRGEAFLRGLMERHPEIAVLAVVSANPVTNTRSVVARYVVNDQFRSQIMKTAETTPDTFPLFTDAEENNKQILAILSGRFYCAPVKDGTFGQVFKATSQHLKYSCRIPLPRFQNKASGWISLHLSEWPVKDYERLEVDSVSTALVYFNTEVNN